MVFFCREHFYVRGHCPFERMSSGKCRIHTAVGLYGGVHGSEVLLSQKKFLYGGGGLALRLPS